METCNIYKYVTIINMFIVSLNRLTVCLVREFVYNLVKQYTAIFDIKQNNIEATGLIEHQYV